MAQNAPNNDKRFELIGWVGFILIIGGYFLLTLKQIEANSINYHALNLIGALCMVANAKNKGATPLLWLNVTWALIALMGLLKLTP